MKKLTTEYSDCETGSFYKPYLQDDQHLWDDFRNGCENSYALIYQSHFYSLYSYGLKICGEREVVKDCIQDLFVYIWRNREKLTTTNSIKYYLYKSLKRRLIDSFRFHQMHFELTEFEAKIEVVCSEENNIIITQTSEAQKKGVLLALEKLTVRQKVL